MTVLLWLALVWLAIYLYFGYLRCKYSWPEACDEIHFAVTADNRRIALHRYRPRTPEAKPLPLFCCHGFGSNKNNLDLGEKHSFARYAAERGYDVWLIDLRGNGLSGEPSFFNRYRFDWTFDDYIWKDIPAAIGLIKEKTGCPKVAWVGHSMGGMLMYAFGQETGEEHLACGVSLGSPGTFAGFHDHLKRLARLSYLLNYLHAVHLRAIIRSIIPLLNPLSGTRFVRDQFTVENVDLKEVRYAAYNAVANVSAGLVQQFADWIENGTWRSSDHRTVWADQFDKLTIPLLLIAGAGDRLVPVTAVKYVFDCAASKDKKLVVAGFAEGFADDYGHDDLVLGKKANADIFDLVLGWIDEKTAKFVAKSEKLAAN